MARIMSSFVMKKTDEPMRIYTGAAVLLLAVSIFVSCERTTPDPGDQKLYNTDIKLILSETMNGGAYKIYAYNEDRTIREVYGQDFYKEYTYVKGFMESIVTYRTEEDLPEEKSMVMNKMLPLETVFDTTNANTKYVTDLIHDSYGRVVVKNTQEINKEGTFPYLSVQIGYELDGRIRERSVTDDTGSTRIFTYEYDNNDNIAIENVYLMVPGESPLHEKKIEYQYDDKRNPFIIFKDEAEPGRDTNKNNITHIKTTWFVDPPASGAVVNQTIAYTYTSQGYPFNVNGIYTYNYESK
jgi:hypothetical protein